MRVFRWIRWSKFADYALAKKEVFMKVFLLCLVLGTGLIQASCAEEDEGMKSDPSSIGKLLSRLNLDASGLEKVKAVARTPDVAARQLLAYYRSRDSVKHPVDRHLKADMLGKGASKEDIKVADNALKHIFVGQPSYPPHFCGDDIDWSTSPVPDKEWGWQFNRMYFWDAMGRVYWHTGDEKYAREWCAQLLDWVKKNPCDKNHSYAWRSIEAGHRGHRWTELFQRFLDSPSFTPEVLTSFLNSCHDHATLLMTSYRKGSNWALMEADGLAFIAMTFPEFEDAEKWRDEAIRRLNMEISNQVKNLSLDLLNQQKM